MSRRGSGRKHGLGQDDGWGVYGGYMAAKVQKLNEQFSEEQPRNREISCAESSIFQGVAIFVNGYTVPSSDELKRLMMIHGGRFIHYYRKTDVTHIIATNLPHAKIRKLNDEKVVRPEWILDSIKAGRLLLYESYQLYGNKTSLQKSLSFQKTASSTSTLPTSISEMSSDASDGVVESSSRTSDIEGLSSNNQCLGISIEMKNVEHNFNIAKDPPQEIINQNCGNLTLPKTSDSPPNEVTGRVPAKAGDPRFVAEFYSNSRLHHISSWGAEFKDLVMQLQKQGDGNFPARDSLRKNGMKEHPECQEDILEAQMHSLDGKDHSVQTSSNGKSDSSKNRGSERIIMHVDMDCFFVSVGLINRPELRGKPVAVTHSRGNGMQQVNAEARQYEQDYYQKKYGRSKLSDGTEKTTEGVKSSGFNSAAEIASCSYEARAAGVRNGMFMGEAKKRCPSIQTIPYDFNLYKEVAQKLYGIVARYTHDIEAVSCDEMFVDISELLSDTMATPLEFASLLRDEIYKETKCNASVGIAHNILLARMSTRVAKPNGQYLLETGQEEDFIKSQPVGDLPGVGWSTKRRLEALSVSTCRDLQLVPMAKLQREFGAKTGEHLFNLCRGKDDRAIQAEKQRKSVSAEINYGIRFTKETEAVDFVSEVTEEVHRRLLKISMKGKMITLKMKVRKPGAPKESSKFLGHGICNNLAKSVSLAQATDDLKVIKEAVLSLLRQMKTEASDMRGIGVQINKLIPGAGEQRHPAAIGTKSLKDFVTSGDKNPSGFIIPDIRPPVKKQVPKTMMNFLRKQSNQDDTIKVIPKEVATSESRSELSAIAQEDDLPKLPSMMPSPAKEGPVRNPDFYPSSISEIDTSVLDALPPDIQLQIQNSFLTRKPDANQKTPLTSTPVPIRSTTTIRTHEQPTTSRASMQFVASPEKEDRPTTSRAALLSKSPDMLELDPSVLKELPDDIVQELMANQQRKMERERLAEEPVEALPNLSQIEPSCLDALPPDMKEELKQAYLNKEHGRQHIHEQSPVKLSPAKANLLKKSPRKSSPGKLSPFGTKRRGRPKKSSPRKLFEKNQPKINAVIKRSPIKEKVDINDKVLHQEATIPASAVDKDEVDNSNNDDAQMRKANLNGAVELYDVKALLWEWMETSEFPRDDDLGLVISYLQELVVERDLVKVDLLLKAIKRYTNKIGTAKWKGAYTTALALVQDRIHQVYNSQLKIS